MESELLHWTNYVITAVLNYTGPYFLHKFVKKKKREKKQFVSYWVTHILDIYLSYLPMLTKLYIG